MPAEARLRYECKAARAPRDLFHRDGRTIVRGTSTVVPDRTATDRT